MKPSPLLLAGLLISILLATACTGLPTQKTAATPAPAPGSHPPFKQQSLQELELGARQHDPDALLHLGEAYRMGHYGLSDPDKAFPPISEAVKSGNPHAMTDMGILYLKGYGTEKDYAAAFSWLKKGAAGGDLKAPRYIGLIYQNGWGKDVNYRKAATSYTCAAQRGDITSQYYLGQLYEKGLGVEQNYQKAFALYQQSAARGDKVSLPAIMALGNLYEQGLGVDRNIDTALTWYARGAALDDAEARAKIARYQYPDNPYVMNVTAMVKVIGDGQKVAALAIKYKESIAPDSVQPADYQVAGRTVTAVYVNNAAAISDTLAPGRFVIVELRTAPRLRAGSSLRPTDPAALDSAGRS